VYSRAPLRPEVGLSDGSWHEGIRSDAMQWWRAANQPPAPPNFTKAHRPLRHSRSLPARLPPLAVARGGKK
jgi:hypothetical protein